MEKITALPTDYDLGPMDPIGPGVHVVYIQAPNSSWVPLLKKLAGLGVYKGRLDPWGWFLAALGRAYNATRPRYRVAFPKGHTLRTSSGQVIWIPRRGYDEKKRALYFLVEFKP